MLILATQYFAEHQELMITLQGVMEQTAIEDFEQAFSDSTHSIKRITLDFHALEYIDSMAVMSFHKLCEHARQKNITVYVKNMKKEIMEQFRLLNLHQLFKPEYHPGQFHVDWVFHPEE